MKDETVADDFSFDLLNSARDGKPLRLLIEASAGTGKTYTLERIVIHFLVEQRYHLGQVLVVTYTRKAARELRVRIRGLLSEMLSSPEKAQEILSEIGLSQARDWEDHLRRQLRDFAQAPITTIHGYAQSVLEHFPAESESLLTTTIDNAYPTELLRDYLRSTLYSGFLPLHDGHRIQGPELAQYLDQTLEFLGIYDSDSLVATLNTVREKGAFDPARFRPGFVNDPHPFDVEKIIRTMSLEDVSRVLAGQNLDSPELDAIHALFGTATPQADTPSIFRIARAFSMIFSILSALPAYRDRQTRYMGLMSYDDLILKLDRATVHGGLLLPRLQEASRLILIDEFQDTDSVQWGIFQRIAGTEAHLIAVGDPKQAIYGFRGADLNTYLSARQGMKNTRRLSHNFRSSPLLVAACNTLFSGIFNQTHDSELKPRLEASPVHSGLKNPAARVLLANDGTLLAPIQFLQIEETSTKAAAMEQNLSQETVAHLQNLFQQGRILADTEDGAAHRVSYNDFCILTQNNKQSLGMHKALLAQGIPARVSGQAKLVESAEADDLAILLEAVEQPASPPHTHKLFLTRFYSAGRSNSPTNESDKLSMCAEDCARWHTDFASLGLVGILAELELRVRPGLIQTEGLRASRSLANYQHIADLFQSRLSSEHVPASRIGKAFASFRHDYGTVDEENLRLDRDGDFVTIMTIHSSKGLEFPIVYVYAGLSETKIGNHRILIPILDQEISGSWLRSIDPWESKAGYRAHARREWEEWLRLFYVAATRARSALILPAFDGILTVENADEKGLPGSFSPMRLMHERKLIVPATFLLSPSTQSSVQVPILTRADSLQQNSPELEALSLQFELPKTVPTLWRNALSPWPERQSSFTSLSKHQETHAPDSDSLFLPMSQTEDQHEPVLPEPDPEPAGAAYGTVLHRALELLDFGAYAMADEPQRVALIKSLLDNEIEAMASCLNFGAGFSGFSAIRPYLSRHVSLALSAQLESIHLSPRAVVTLDAKTALREASFHARLNQAGIIELPARFSVARRPIQTGFLTGTIDLLAKIEGRWSVIDWKSNRAGSGTTLELENTMRDNEYYLQAFIYMSAVHQWLCARHGLTWNPSTGTSIDASQTRAREIFESELGSAWYVFARYGATVAITATWDELRDFQMKAGLHVTTL